MKIQVRVPQVGESISEGVIASWAADDGAIIDQDDPLFELETDKVTMTVQAQHAGRLKILVPADSEVKIGQVVAEIDTDAAEAEQPPSNDVRPNSPTLRVPQTSGPAINPVAGMPQAKHKLAREQLDELAPAVRSLVLEHSVNPDEIRGTGRDGRITKQDVLRYLEKRKEASQPSEPPTPTPDPEPSTQAPSASSNHSAAKLPTKLERRPEVRETRVKMSRLRQRIAERLVSVKNDTAMLTSSTKRT